MASKGGNSRQQTIHQVDPKKLKPHPENEKVYQDGPTSQLTESIKEGGIIDALVVERKTKLIVSGRRRHKTALALKLKRVPVIYRDYDTELDLLEAIVTHNRYRQKSDAQILMEVELLTRVEQERAKLRKEEAGRRAGKAAGRGRPKKGVCNVAHTLSDAEKAVVRKHDAGGKGGQRIVGRQKIAKRRAPRRADAAVGEAVGKSARTVAKAQNIIGEAKRKRGKDWQKDQAVQAVMNGKASLHGADKKIRETKEQNRRRREAKKKPAPAYSLHKATDITGIPDASVDHVLTDPPYGVATKFKANFRGRADMSSQFDGWDVGELQLDEIKLWCVEWHRVMSAGGNIGVFCSDDYLSFLKLAFRQVGFGSVQSVGWHKTNPEPSVRKKALISSLEYLVIGTKGKSFKTFNWIDVPGMHNHIEAPIVTGKARYDHPAQKPERVIRWWVDRFTSPGDSVLDNFAGTGTVGAVCKAANRQFVLVEREQRYIDIIRERLG